MYVELWAYEGDAEPRVVPGTRELDPDSCAIQQIQLAEPVTFESDGYGVIAVRNPDRPRRVVPVRRGDRITSVSLALYDELP